MPKKHKGALHTKGRGTTKKRKAEWRPATRSPGGIARLRLYIKRNWVVVRSCLIFASCLAVFILIYSKLLANSGMMEAFFNFTAWSTGSIVNLFGGSVQVDHALISSPDFSMSIVANCTALIPIIIFTSAVLAFPSTIKQKAIGILLGIVAIYALNLVRTVSLFFIGSHFSESIFNMAHFLIWQSLMIILAIVLWLFWVERLARATPK